MRHNHIGLALLLGSALAPAAAAQDRTVILGATVIDGTASPPRPGQAVVIERGRITDVRPAAGYRPPSGTRVVDARGRWLIPGLIDMHAHVALGPVEGMASGTPAARPDPTGARRSLRTLLAWGVTTIRDPGGPAEAALALRDSVSRGLLPGPRLFVAGEVIDLTSFPGLVRQVRSAEDVRAEVRRQAALGVDYVKLYATLPPALVCAGVEEAHSRGVKAIAHLFATSWTAAARCGIDGIVHAVPSSPLLLGPERRAAFLRNVARNTRFMFQWFEHVDLESPELDSMIRAMVERRVVHDPTLAVFEAMAWGDSERITQSPDLVAAPPALLENWRSSFQLTLGWRPAEYDSARAVWPMMLRFVKLLYDRGVFLVAGTDANNPWVVAGPSLHRELELLAAAGIPPAEVLRMATGNAASALGHSAEAGTIEVGKRADLVLLTADPLSSISNTRRIAWVMQGGRLWRPAELLADFVTR